MKPQKHRNRLLLFRLLPLALLVGCSGSWKGPSPPSPVPEEREPLQSHEDASNDPPAVTPPESIADRTADGAADGGGGSPDNDPRPPTISPRARVCLDPGHPTYPEDKLYEAILNRKVIHYLSRLLIQSGFAVLVTVNDLGPEALFEEGFDNTDTALQQRLMPVPLDDRIEICDIWKGDFLISVHHNGGLVPETNRALVFFGMNDALVPWNEESREWARMTARHLEQAMEVSYSTVVSDQEKLGFSLGILKSQSFMSILTEAGFYTIDEERERLNDDNYLRGEAQAIFRGFLDFFASLEESSAERAPEQSARAPLTPF